MKRILTIVIVAMVALGLGVGGYFIFSGDSDGAIARGVKKDREYTVRFQTNGGSLVETQTVKKGEAVECPDDPVRENFTFIGWYANKSCTTLFDFNKPIKKSCTVYARWVDMLDAAYAEARSAR